MKCITCETEKSETEFPIRGNGKRRGQCRVCRNTKEKERRAIPGKRDREKENAQSRVRYQQNRTTEIQRSRRWNVANHEKVLGSHLKKFFGITFQDYQRMIDEQGNKCAICENPETAIDKRTGKVRRLHVDHNHRTKRVRGLLCSRCNIGIGYLMDDPRIARKAADYLIDGEPSWEYLHKGGENS